MGGSGRPPGLKRSHVAQPRRERDHRQRQAGADRGDGRFDPARAREDRLSAYGHDVDYALTAGGRDFLEGLGVAVGPGPAAIRYCVAWSEQRHHLSGGLGRALLARLLELDWIRRREGSRAVTVTELGERELPRAFPAALRAAA